MKLNEKGKALADKWYGIYEAELEKIRKETNDPNYCEGWCIVDDYDHVHSIEDDCGLLLMGYECGAFYEVLGRVDDGDIGLDDEWSKYATTRAILWTLATQYLNMEDDEDMDAVIALVA